MTRASRTAARERPDVLVAADQRRGLEPQPLAHRPVGGQQLAVQGPERRSRVDAEPVGQVGAVPLVAPRARRARRARPRSSAAGPRPRPRRRRARRQAAGAPRRGRPGPTAPCPGRRWRRRGAGSRQHGGRPAARPRRCPKRAPPGLPGPGRGRGSGRGGPPPRGRPPPRRGARARRRPRRAARAGSRGRCGPPRRARSASGPARPRPAAPWPGWPGTSSGPQTSSTSRSSETWLPAATRAASRAWVRPPGSGVPCQDTSSSSSRSTGVSVALPRNARRPGRPQRRAPRSSPASVRVRSGARNRSAKASDLWPAPTWSPV